MCSVYTGELRGFIEERLAAKAGGADEDMEELVIHAPDPIDYELLIGSLNTKSSICSSGCSCSSGSVPSKVQETKDAFMETEDSAETQDNKSERMLSGVTVLTPLPNSDGEK